MDDKLYRSSALSQLPRKVGGDADNAVDLAATHQGFRLGHRRDVTRGDVVRATQSRHNIARHGRAIF